MDALPGASALVIVTDWREFKSPDLDEVALRLRYPVVFDGRNLFDPSWVVSHNLEYYAIGRTTGPVLERHPAGVAPAFTAA
jgi:UDPglucose 6-dehydrogenase